ncbi:hypothetical protein BDR07DRAFT_1479277 [Suillus spraguei]|nr:hypothetical protein BDR07DRAFT_1479277 [Suillus spraguei]
MTSGKSVKTFPRYRPPPHLLQNPLYLALPQSDGTILLSASMRYPQILKIDSGGRQSKKVTVCSLGIGFLRMTMNWDAKHDDERLDLWSKPVVSLSLVHADPQPTFSAGANSYAISLVKSYRAFFILNALFAWADRRYIENEWSLLVDCIEKSIIPDVEILDHLRKLVKPNTLRTTELREIGPPGIQGWALTRILGPSIPTQATGHGSSEGSMALRYHRGDPNTNYK